MSVVTSYQPSSKHEHHQFYPILVCDPQPTWPEGRTPDAISAIVGGFVDGDSVRHAVPRALAGAPSVGLVRNTEDGGRWWWYLVESWTVVNR